MGTISMGKPVVTGTRITVELILGKLAAGEAVEQAFSVIKPGRVRGTLKSEK